MMSHLKAPAVPSGAIESASETMDICEGGRGKRGGSNAESYLSLE